MLTLNDIIRNTKELRKKHGWNENIYRQCLYLTTETGEALKEVIKLQSSRYTEEQKNKIKEDLGLELFDIIWNVCSIAAMLDIDLDKACESKMKINDVRTW